MTDTVMVNIREKKMNSSLSTLNGQRFCTDDHPKSQRLGWLKEIIGREYANVDVSEFNHEPVFNDMAIYPWLYDVRFSSIRTHSLRIERLSKEPTEASQDCYFAVLLTDGCYKLEQDGREVFLNKGEMALYDATEWHRITMPESTSKVIISIPRDFLKQRLSHVSELTARKIGIQSGIGTITSNTIQSLANQLSTLDIHAFQSMFDPLIDMLTLSLNELVPNSVELSHTQNSTLFHIKRYIDSHIHHHNLSPAIIANAVGLSVRYINNLFHAEHTSLMRYVTQQRLNRVYRQLQNQQCLSRTITELALEAGFNDIAHFSRAFKMQFGLSPRQFRQENKKKILLFNCAH